MLENLNPKKVFAFFEDICAIPHGSGNTKMLSDYCVSFAEKRGLEHIQDGLGNVIIKKPASAGYEQRPAVILQGHIDMVCEKAPWREIDFNTEGLKLGIDGDWIFAEGTTLGADNGIAVAMALCILDDDSLPHPPLEVVLTVDEETGMYGAEGLDCSALSGRLLINIDSEEEGVITAGCAGGARAEIRLPVEYEPCGGDAYKITVSGLIGGHSGVEIDKGRQNSSIMMGRFLKRLPECRVVTIAGGLKDNAIPVLTQCVVVADNDPQTQVENFLKENRVKTDSGLSVSVEKTRADRCMTADSSRRVIEFLNTTPNGIVKMSEDVKGLPETSLNLGILYCEEGAVCASFAVRSAVSAEKQRLLERLERLAKDLGGEYSSHGHYPAWEFKKASRLRDTMCRVWQEKTGNGPQVVIIHAGLECGLFCGKMPGLDAVSLGPDMKEIHTCRERLSISSTARVYEYICEVLKQL